MTAQSQWSKGNPKLQVAWDATSLKVLMECPWKYKTTIIEGYRKREGKVDTDFGGFFATCTETYQKARLSGKSKDMATVEALRKAIEVSWIRGQKKDCGNLHCEGDCCETSGQPWGGEYATVWRCTGSEPYKNRKGNRAKCPFSHAGKWFPEPTPSVCGECGSPVHAERRWHADSKIKDRPALIRLVGWYCDEQPEELTGGQGLAPYAFPDGTPAVELSFAFPLPFFTPYGEPYIIAGHLDGIKTTLGDQHWITDNKTTSKTLSANYWLQYTPNVQVDTYDFVGSVAYTDLKIKGVAIEGAQITAEGAKFGTGLIYRTEGLRAEYLKDLEWWIRQAERYAAEDYWPRNRASCFLCDLKTICGKDPSMRDRYLEQEFERRYWNPLEER
jgi:hypothetical protein